MAEMHFDPEPPDAQLIFVAMQNADDADKQAIRAGQAHPPATNA